MADNKVRIALTVEGSRETGNLLKGIEVALSAINDILAEVKNKSSKGVFDTLIKDAERIQKQAQDLQSALGSGLQTELTNLASRFQSLTAEVQQFVQNNPGFDQLTQNARQLNQELSQFGDGTNDFTKLATTSQEAAAFLARVTENLNAVIAEMQRAKTVADSGVFDQFIADASRLSGSAEQLQQDLSGNIIGAVDELKTRLTSLAGELEKVGGTDPNFTRFAKEVNDLNQELAAFGTGAESFEKLISDAGQVTGILSGVQDVLSRVANEINTLSGIVSTDIFSNFVTDAARFISASNDLESELAQGSIPAIRQLISESDSLAGRLNELSSIDPGFARLGTQFRELNAEVEKFRAGSGIFSNLETGTESINANLQQFAVRISDVIEELNRTKTVIDSGLFDQFVSDAQRVQSVTDEIRASLQGNNIAALQTYGLELETLTNRLSQAASTNPNFDVLAGDLTRLNSEVERFNNEIGFLYSLDGEVINANNALGQLPATITRIVGTLEDLKNLSESRIFSQLGADSVEVQGELSGLQAALRTGAADGADAFTAALGRLSSSLSEVRSDFPAFDQLAATFRGLNAEVEKLQGDIQTFSNLNTDAEALRASLLQLTSTLPNVQRELQQIRSEADAGLFDNILTETDRLKTATAEIEQALTGQVVQSLNRFKTELQAVEASLQQVRTVDPGFTELSGELNTLNTELSKFTTGTNIFSGLGESGKDAEESFTRLIQVLGNVQIAIRDLQTAASAGVFDELIQGSARLTDSFQDVQRIVGDSTQSEVQALKDEVEDLTRKIAILSTTDTNLDKLANEAQKVASATDELKETNIRDLGQGADETAAELARVELALKRVSDELKEAKRTADQNVYGNLRREQIALQQEGASLRKEIRDQEKAFKSAEFPEDSIIRLRQRYRELKREIDGLSTADPNFDKLSQEAKQLSDRINDLNKEAGSFKDNIGRYEEGVTSALQATEGLLSGSLSSIVGSLGVGGPVAAGLAVIGGTVAVIADLTNEFITLRGETERLTQTTGQQSSEITANIKAIADTYDKDFNEVLVATNALAKQTGISFEESIKLITQGFDAGADVTDDFLDKVREYPVQFANAGFSAEEFIKIATQEVQGGFFNDKLLDAIKESDIALKEFTQTQRDALSALGDEFTANLEEGIRTGTISTQEALLQISTRAKEVGLDFQQFATITADVFKGAGEDAGGAQRVLGEVFKALNTDISDYIDTSNELTQRQQAQREAAVELNLAIAELSDQTGDFSASTSTMGTQIQTVLVKGAAEAVEVFRGFYLTAIKPIVDIFISFANDLGLFSKRTEEAADKTSLFQKILNSLLIPFRIVIFTSTLVVRVFKTLVDTLKAVASFFEPVIDRIKEATAFLKPLGEGISGFIKSVSDGFSGLFDFAAAARKETAALAKERAAAEQTQIRNGERVNEVLEKQKRILIENLSSIGVGVEEISRQTGVSIDRIKELTGAVEKSTTESADAAGGALDRLQQKQSDLRKAIEEKIVTGEPFGDLEAEYVEVTRRLEGVSDRFSLITDKIRTTVEKANEFDLAKARTELTKTFQTLESGQVDTAFIRQLGVVQDQLLEIAKRSSDISELSKKVDELKAKLSGSLAEVSGGVTDDIDALLANDILSDVQFAQVKGLIELETALRLQGIQTARDAASDAIQAEGEQRIETAEDAANAQQQILEQGATGVIDTQIEKTQELGAISDSVAQTDLANTSRQIDATQELIDAKEDAAGITPEISTITGQDVGEQVEDQNRLADNIIQAQEEIRDSIQQTGDLVAGEEARKRDEIDRTLDARRAAESAATDAAAGAAGSIRANIEQETAQREAAAARVFQSERAFALQEQQIKLQGQERLLDATVKNLESQLAQERELLAQIGEEENQQTAQLLTNKINAERQLAETREELSDANNQLQLQQTIDRINSEADLQKIRAAEEIQDREALQQAISEIDSRAAIEQLNAELALAEEGSAEFLSIKRELALKERAIDDETAENALQNDLRRLEQGAAQEQLDILNSTLTIEEKRNELRRIGLELELKRLQAERDAASESDQAGFAVQIRESQVELASFLSQLGKTPDEIATATGLAIDDINAIINDAKRNAQDGILPDSVFQKLQQSAGLLSNIFALQAQQLEARNQQEIEALDAELAKRLENVQEGSEEEAKIREEFEQQKIEIEKDAARKRKQIALTEAIIQTALAVIKALPNAFLAALAAAQGAIQIATIQAQEFARGGVVLPEPITGRRVRRSERNIPTRRNGDNVLATVRVGEVVLNEEQQRRLMMLSGGDIFRRLRVPGFADGGIVGGNIPQVVNPNEVVQRQVIISKVEFSDEQINRMANTIASRVATRTGETVGGAVRAASREELNRKRLSEQTR